MYKMIFILAVAVTGVIEWLKGILPEKVKDNKVIITAISGVVSAAAGALFVTFANKIGFVVEQNVYNYIAYIGGTVGLVQVAYNVLLQTFKGVVAKLKANAKVDTLTADEIADEIESKVKEAVANASK